MSGEGVAEVTAAPASDAAASLLASQTDEAVRRRVWEGQIPVVFQLADDEVQSGKTAVPIFKMCPRMSYLPLITDGFREHFGAAPYQQGNGEGGAEETASCNEMWFDYKGTPLKWHIPLGVLFDVLQPSELPWPINVHFKGFPEEKLLSCPDPVKETVRVQYLNTLKEAMFLRHGSAKAVMNLSMADQTQMWEAVANSNYDDYWAINTPLKAAGDPVPKSYAIRMYRSDILSWTQQPVDPSGVVTLLDLVRKFFPDLITYEAGEGSGQDVASMQQPQFKVVVQGIAPSLNTPLAWLNENCCHTENCLHICIHTQ